jgi:hypothetical protein
VITFSAMSTGAGYCIDWLIACWAPNPQTSITSGWLRIRRNLHGADVSQGNATQALTVVGTHKLDMPKRRTARGSHCSIGRIPTLSDCSSRRENSYAIKGTTNPTSPHAREKPQT